MEDREGGGVMFDDMLKRKYALSDVGVGNAKKGIAWTIVVNLVVMGGIGFLYFLMLQFMEVLVVGADLPQPLVYLAGVVAFLLLSLFTHLQQYQNTYSVVYGEVANMRISLAERLRKLPLGFFGKRDLADLTETLMSDVKRLEHVWSHVVGYLYGSYISTVVIAIMLFVFDWRLALACLWGVPVAFALLFGTRSSTSKNAIAGKKAAIAVADGVQETLENIREIRATNQEQRFLDRLYASIDEGERVARHAELVTGIFVNLASVVMRLGVATTILVGASLMLSGQLDFMVLFMFLLVITRIYAPFDQSLALIAEVFMSEVSVDRLNGIFDEPIAEGSEDFAPRGHDIDFKGVNFAYDGDDVLHDVSFTAKEGEVTALVGPSGSGKSTCARLAARLLDVSEGSIEVGGVDISTVDPEVLMRDYSMVFQDVVLFDDTVMGENGARLSGGERQRISIARALLKDAPIVLLDEATASLDVENETKVQGALSRLLEGKTVLVIAHRMRTVEAADKIVVLKDGRVAEQGAPGELRQLKGGIYRHMAELQSASASWKL